MDPPVAGGDGTAEGRPGARRPLVLAVAVAAALAAGWAAPRSWPEGAGRLRVSWRGAAAVDAPVAVGGRERVEASGEAGGFRVSARLAAGVPVRAPVQAAVRVEGPGGAPPSSADLRVSLLLPDGREELLPVTGRGEGAGAFLAERRPPVRTASTLGLLALVVVLWVTEAVPLYITALLVPVVLVVSGAATARESLAPFFDPIIALFFGGFLMAEAMRRVGLDRLAARFLVAKAGRSPGTLFAGLAGTTAFLSLWMSNTAATALVLPVALAVSAPLGQGFRRAVVLGVAYAATVGGTGCLVGTPANLLAARFLGEFCGRPVSFPEWFAFGMPLVLLLMPVMGIHLWRRHRVAVDPGAFAEARRVAAGELAAAGRPDAAQWTVLAVFAAVAGLWVTEEIHHVDAGVVALGGAAALALAGKIETGDLGRISWEALLTFGGGITMGLFVVRSGASDWLACGLEGLSALPPFAGVAVVAGITLLVTAFASNTASASMMIPLMIPMAAILRVDPAVLVVTAALASSVDFALVVGTPPTMMAYATGLFTTREIFRTGILVDLAGLALLVSAVPLAWRLLGLVNGPR